LTQAFHEFWFFNSLQFPEVNKNEKRSENKEKRYRSKKKPNPRSKANTPVSIGFLVYAYGLDVTNWGGGLKGTGVPFTLRKF
jgi:hypothetical protein